MSTDDFINIVKSVRSIPEAFLQTNLANAVRFSDSNVQSIFFPDESAQDFITHGKSVAYPVLQNLAAKYATFLLSTVTSYNYNQAVSCDYSVIGEWFSTNTNVIGQSMFIDYMMQANMLGGYFQDPVTWASKISSDIGTNDFLTGLLVECDKTLGSDLPAKVALLMLRVIDNDGPNFLKVLEVWKRNPRWLDNLEGYDAFPWLETIEPSFRQGGPVYSTLIQNVRAACTKQTNSTWSRQDPTTGMAYDTNLTCYGISVRNWIMSGANNSPYPLGLANLQSIPNNCTETPLSGTGCVIAGTSILMEGGSVKAIQEIVEGDKVVSGGGVTSVCSNEIVVNEQLTQLYSINDDEPFMSLEHAIMTQRGWCSLAPKITMELTPHHSVKLLTNGDVVLKIKHFTDGKIEYEKVVVNKINIREFNAGEGPVGFDIHLRNGHHSYHANGYCSLVTYPEITAQRITSNVLSHMSLSEQMKFDKELQAMAPLLEKALGASVFKAVVEALKRPQEVASRGKHTDAFGIKKRYIKGPNHMIIPKLQVSMNPDDAGVRAGISDMALMHGNLFINGSPVETHCQENNVYWSRNLADGATENGAMRMMSHGQFGNGIVQIGDKKIAFTANGLIGYNTTYGPNNQIWFEFDMGFLTNNNGESYATGQLSDPAGNNVNLQKYSNVVFSTVQNAQSQTVLHADIEFNPNYCAFGGSNWIAAEINFTLDYSSFTGKLYPYDSSQPGYRGTAINLSGRCKDQTTLNTMRRNLTDRMLKQPVNTAFFDVNHPDIPVAASIQPSILLADDISNSVKDLFDSTPPDIYNLHQLSFGKLKNLMLLALGNQDEEWLSWFGETKPGVGEGQALSQQDADLIKDSDINSFLVNQFSMGYLTQTFSKSTDPKIKDKFAQIPNVDEKLGYFWKGDGNTSFSKSKGYNLATAKLMDNTYAEVVPLLNNYLNDNPVNWAKKLYDYCTKTPEVITGLAMQTEIGGRLRLTHLSSILHALDPIARIEKPNGKKISYATSLYECVMNVRVNEVIKYARLSDQVDMVDFLTEYFKQYFASLLEGDKWADNIRTDALQELTDLMKQFDVDNANALVEHLESFITDSVQILLSLKDGPIAERIQGWINSPELEQRHPTLSKVLKKGSFALGAGLSIGLYIYSMWKTIGALLDWKDLSPANRVQTITTVFDVAASMFNDFSKFMAAKTLATAGADMQDMINASGIMMDNLAEFEPVVPADEIAYEVFDLKGLDAPALVRAGQAAGVAIQDAEDVAKWALRWANISRVTEVVAAGMSILAVGAACVAGGFQIANDFATGQPASIIVLDILGEISNGVAFIAATIEGVATLLEATLSVIPVVGVVAAIVGVLLSFIAMFIHRKQPPTPQETFVDEHCVPFVNGLALPPQEWLDKQNKLPNQSSTSLRFALA